MAFLQDFTTAAREVTQTLVTTAVEKSVVLAERINKFERETRGTRMALKLVAQDAFARGVEKLEQVGNKIAVLLDETPAPVAKKAKAKKSGVKKKK